MKLLEKQTKNFASLYHPSTTKKLHEIYPTVLHHNMCESVEWLLLLVLAEMKFRMGLDVKVRFVVVIPLTLLYCAMHDLDDLYNKIFE